MPCTTAKIGDAIAIVCTRGHRRCRCGRRATLQCDFPMPARRSGTCDAPICVRCAREAGPDLHHCPRHDDTREAA